MPVTRFAGSALALLVLATALTSCSSGVAVPLPEPLPEGAAAYACAALKSELPDEVLGNTTTATTPTSSFTSAWGAPAVVVRCGVAAPVALTATSALITVDGIDWLPEQLERGYLFTTVGRELNIEVTVPDAYRPESDALVDLAPAVSTIPVIEATPAP